MPRECGGCAGASRVYTNFVEAWEVQRECGRTAGVYTNCVEAWEVQRECGDLRAFLRTAWK
ncbi:hypothetical protein, partial [Leptospira gomenensis]|uniref:hypothetical protein n=1 Tax=Leptospira gomenensis TaxID=2484974 RepID=UPI001AEF4DF6